MKKLAKLSLVASIALTTTLSALDEPVKNPVIPIKGNAWQLFGFNQPIDLKATFNGTPVKVIWAWDNDLENWEAYSPQYAINMALKDVYPNIEVLQPNQGFWVMSYEDTDVEMKGFLPPLFEMCVNVNSPEYWENTTDEDGQTLAEPYPECDAYVDNLPAFEVIDSFVDFDGEIVKGNFVTNLPVVYLENQTDGSTVPLKDFVPENADQFIAIDDADINLTNVMINVFPDESEKGSVVEYSFEPSDSNFTLIEMGFSISPDLNQTFHVSMPFDDNSSDDDDDNSSDDDNG